MQAEVAEECQEAVLWAVDIIIITEVEVEEAVDQEVTLGINHSLILTLHSTQWLHNQVSLQVPFQPQLVVASQ
jgi:hypothetical protein